MVSGCGGEVPIRKLEDFGVMRSATGEVSSALEAAFEDLPCIALIERDGYLVAKNALARKMTGTACGGHEAVRVDQVLEEAFALDEGEDRCCFDCLLRRKFGPSLAVSAVSQRTTFEGEPSRLILLLERSGGSEQGKTCGLQVEDLMEAIPEATVITHAEGIVHVNQEFTRLFGYSLMDCVGVDLSELVVPDGRKHEGELMLHMLQKSGRGEMDTVRRTRTGEELDVCVRMVRLRLGGAAYGMLVTYRDIRREKKESAKLTHSARHDGLTGLANRTQFLERVQLTLGRLRRRPDRRFAVIFLDLDGFKQVNDTMGHAAGDALLVQVAERLTRCLRPQDAVARFGGDEFAMLLDESGNVGMMEAIAMRIQAEIQRPMELEGLRTARVSASMGVVIASLAHENAEEILVDADVAMYRAKAAGKACSVVIDGSERLAMLGFLHGDSEEGQQ